jgi:ubiquinone/menaquinone biosynthesis C-methylase UbiE
LVIADIDTSAALAYEARMVPAFMGEWALKALRYVDLQPGEAVLDVACGTGVAARAAAALVGPLGQVTGVDLDPAMIEVARRAAEDAAVRVQWHCASALQLPLSDHATDACLCVQGLQFFPDRVAALAEMRRVLKSTGRLVTSTWASLPSCVGYAALIEALDRQGVDTVGPRKAFAFGDPGELHRAATEAGYRSVEIHTEDGLGRCPSVQAFVDTLASGSTTLRFALAQLSEAGRRQLIEDASATLAPYVKDEFEWPMQARILYARP